MNIRRAFEILEIDFKSVNLTSEFIKKKYHRLALINHPDKNGNTLRFQEINEAYEYLLNELNFDNFDNFDTFVSSDEPKSVKNKYIYLLSLFIGSIVKGDCTDVIKNVIQEIVTDCKEVTLKGIFDKLDKDVSLEIYSFICKYKHILHISNDTLDFVSLLIKQKHKNDRVFILNPSITDLLDNNIYKLYVDGLLYLVPLWHNELYFDSPDGDIIVICNPELPSHITLDEDNNIHIIFQIEDLLDLINNHIFVRLLIGEREFNIPIHELYIKKEQIYILVAQGISQVSETDIYNIGQKSNIFVKVII
jgi:hypothetical protein